MNKNDNDKINNNIIDNKIKKMTAYIEKHNNISNKEALKDKIHEIHNFLRNNGVGYGMNALKVFNIIYGLKKIEENGLLDKLDIARPECEFSYLLEFANKNEGERVAELIYVDILDSLSINKQGLREMLFYEIPRNIKGSVLAHLVKEINKITIIEKTCNVLLSGKIYEYFIGRDESAISELGAYFTDRHIVDYILNKLNPEINEDGTISSMIDMFGGSGGFTTGYIDYLKNKYNQLINWNEEINKIHHYDMNEDVIRAAGLEFFCLTGVLPNMDKNLRYKNSFVDEFNNNKFKYILTNPPYGGDKNKKSDEQNKRDKMKNYIKNVLPNINKEGLRIRIQKQLKKILAEEKQEKLDAAKSVVSIQNCSARIQRFAKKYGLKGNDKESCSLMLMMDMLEIGGTAIGVLKEGVFFTRTYKDLRKCLIENFNVKEIISVPQDQFENTSTKTSIIIFNNSNEKTNQVKFSNLIIERCENDIFEIFDCPNNDENIIPNDNVIIQIENKGDIISVNDILVSVASKNEILENSSCSLNSKDYNKIKTMCGQDYKLVQLNDICQFLPKSKRNATFGQDIGMYNFYTSSDKVKKCDIVDYNEPALIIGSGGVANIKIDNEFSCSADNFIVKSKYLMYLYYLLIGNMNLLIDGFTGSTLKHLSKEYLKNLELPMPKSEAKIKEWVDKISKPYNTKNKKQNKIKELEEFVKNRIKEISENEDCDEVKLGDICVFLPKSKRNASFGKTSGLFNFYTSSDKVKKCDVADYNEPALIIGTGGVANIKIDNEFSCSADNFIVKSKYLMYLYYLFNSNMNLLIDGFTGSTLKHLSKDYLKNLNILMPKNEKLVQDLEPIFQQLETLQDQVKNAEELYKQYIQELSHEAIPQNDNIVEHNDNDTKDDNKTNDDNIETNDNNIDTDENNNDDIETIGNIETDNIDQNKKTKKSKTKKILTQGNYKLTRLADLCKITTGIKKLPKKKAIPGSYDVYNGINTTYTHNKFNIKKFNVLISKTLSDNNVTLINKRAFITDQVFRLENDNAIMNKFIGYYLAYNQQNIFNTDNFPDEKITEELLSEIQIPIQRSKDKIKEYILQKSKKIKFNK